MLFLQFFAVMVAGVVAYSLTTAGRMKFDTEGEAKILMRMVIWRAFFAVLVMVGTLVVVFDYSIVIR